MDKMFNGAHCLSNTISVHLPLVMEHLCPIHNHQLMWRLLWNRRKIRDRLLLVLLNGFRERFVWGRSIEIIIGRQRFISAALKVIWIFVVGTLLRQCHIDQRRDHLVLGMRVQVILQIHANMQVQRANRALDLWVHVDGLIRVHRVSRRVTCVCVQVCLDGCVSLLSYLEMLRFESAKEQ